MCTVMRANQRRRWVQVWRAWRSRRRTRCSRRRTRTATGNLRSRRSSRGPTSGWAAKPAGITTTRITTTTAASSFTPSTMANRRARGRSSDAAWSCRRLQHFLLSSLNYLISINLVYLTRFSSCMICIFCWCQAACSMLSRSLCLCLTLC